MLVNYKLSLRERQEGATEPLSQFKSILFALNIINYMPTLIPVSLSAVLVVRVIFFTFTFTFTFLLIKTKTKQKKNPNNSVLILWIGVLVRSVLTAKLCLSLHIFDFTLKLFCTYDVFAVI